MRVRVDEVDERDSSWEVSAPRFRVYLHGSGPDQTRGWTSTHDVVGADVLQVIDWAQRQVTGDMTYAVALVHDADQDGPGRGRGLVWLVGRDGNDTLTDDPTGAEAQRRMLARRVEPVGVPVADRMPDPLVGA